ncbi:MAG TPA: tetratricopeptide repeat protein [Blastocatellia bacterium]|nr:tetratricopeptide repeat protein [Blastocatellia bacterium]
MKNRRHMEIQKLVPSLALFLLITFTFALAHSSAEASATAAQRAGQKKPEAKNAETKRPGAKKAQPASEQPQSGSPRDLLERARAASTQQERIDLLERIIGASRDSSVESEARELLMREYALKGEQYLREADPQRAAQAFKMVLRTAPRVINDKIFGQFIFPMPMAMNAFGFRAESADLMRSFESRFEGEPNRLVEIGFFYVQIEAPLEAVRVLERAVQLAPNDHRAHNSLGTAYLINLRLDDAAAEFSRALELDARDEFANLNLANLARANGDYRRAVDYYRKQLEVKPDDSEAHGGLAIALLALGRDEEAEPEIKRATELAPGDYRFLTQLAYFYTARKKVALARPLIERVVRIEPRYAWAFITKANMDLIEGKFGDALSTLISAQGHANFPTLAFELVKALMALDGYDQALEVMGKAITVNEGGEFEALLGGAIKARSPRIDMLLERERQASLFLNEQPTTGLQYRLAEAIAKIEHFTNAAMSGRKTNQPGASRRRARPDQSKSPAAGAARGDQGDLKGATRPRRVRGDDAQPVTAELSAGSDANLPGMTELLRAITAFTTLDDGRQPFRMVWVARKLTDSGIALDVAEQLARRAISMAEAATEPAGSMRDAPLLDREGRRAVFLGRAYDALGWALFKKGDAPDAVEALSQSVKVYPQSGERKTALWHLAVATQEAGNERRALDLYIASYEPESPTSGVRRARIESLYRKLNGSLAGLDEKLKQQ